jgi:multidrug efflux pump subunit AcrB
MGPLVDISVVVLESVHRQRHAKKGEFEAALDGTSVVVLPALAATLTTMAVLLPVLLLFGLAKKLFSPLALTVAVGMLAGYFISMTITPVACRYLLGDPHRVPGKLARRVEAAIAELADRYARLLRAVLPFRHLLIAAALSLVAMSVFFAVQLPSTFFPEIDESMECIYVKLAPGTSLRESSRRINEMGELLKRELPRNVVKLVIANIGSPQNASAALTSPNAGAHMGFIRLELSDFEHRKESQREIADRARALLSAHYPGVLFLQAPGGWSPASLPTGTLRPSSSKSRASRSRSWPSSRSRSTRWRGRCRGSSTSIRSCRSTIPRCASRPSAARRDSSGSACAARRRRRSRRRSATSTPPASGSTTATATPTTSSRRSTAR